MKSTFMKAGAAVAILAVLVLTTWGAILRAAAVAEPVSGTIYGAYDHVQQAWVGHAIFQIGDRAPATATFVDRNTSFFQKHNGAIYGTETISLTFSDGGFDILARFSGVPGSTPSLYTLHEVGAVANGKGTKYANLTGSVSVRGPFLFPDPAVTPGSAPWIAEIHGSVQGFK